MSVTVEQLINGGISNEIATQIITNINTIFKNMLNNNYVSKQSFNEVNTAKNTLQTQLDTANAEVTRLKPFETNVGTLQEQVNTLTNSVNEWKTKYDNQAVTLANENLVKTALNDVVVDLDDVFPKIDMSKVVFKDGKIESGLQEQIDIIKTAKPHYFKTVNNNQPNNIFTGITPKNSNDNNNNTDTKDVAFAKALASSITNQSDIISKANDIYFKGGIN